MARSTAKVILFSKVKHENKLHQWPTAVFNSHEEARNFATVLMMAHKSGDAESARKMDPHTALGGDGKLIAGLKFSIVEVPYSPSAAIGSDDIFEDDPKPAV